MNALTPSQHAAIRSAALDPHHQITRMRGWYGNTTEPSVHSARTVMGLHRLGYLAEAEAGFQSRYTLTPAGELAYAAQGCAKAAA